MNWKETVRKIAGKIAGVNKLQEQIDGLHYILNACVDIRSFPKATGALRELQECDLLLLKIVDKVCRKHSLIYWLDSGTLLGAARHGGFIPWDDDLDVCMPRDNFDRAKTILCEELRSYGLQAEEDIPMGRIGVGYKHNQTGVWLDIFPVDYCNQDLRISSKRDTLTESIHKYRKYYMKHKSAAQSELERKKRSILEEITDKDCAVSLLYGPEASGRLYGWNKEEIFPLQEMVFEDHAFLVPANIHIYLTEMYGSGYMQFPKDGYLHHGDKRGSLMHWASYSGTDMCEIKRELEEIYLQCES